LPVMVAGSRIELPTLGL